MSTSPKLTFMVLPTLLLVLLLHLHQVTSKTSNFSCHTDHNCTKWCQVNNPCNEAKCLNGSCHCPIGYYLYWDAVNEQNEQNYFLMCISPGCQNCSHYNWKCNNHHSNATSKEETCICPDGTTLSPDKFQCLADLPPFGPNDKPPSCKRDADCGSHASCSPNGHCSCRVGSLWRRPATGKAYCAQVECTSGGKQCAKYNWVCKGNHCTCPDGFTENPNATSKCFQVTPSSTTQTACKSQSDCEAPNAQAVPGSICYNNLCTCPFGTEQKKGSCIKRVCAADSDCGVRGSCTNQSKCICMANYTLSEDQMQCLKNHTTTTDPPEPTEHFVLFMSIAIVVFCIFIFLVNMYCTHCSCTTANDGSSLVNPPHLRNSRSEDSSKHLKVVGSTIKAGSTKVGSNLIGSTKMKLKAASKSKAISPKQSFPKKKFQA